MRLFSDSKVYIIIYLSNYSVYFSLFLNSVPKEINKSRLYAKHSDGYFLYRDLLAVILPAILECRNYDLHFTDEELLETLRIFAYVICLGNCFGTVATFCQL